MSAGDVAWGLMCEVPPLYPRCRPACLQLHEWRHGPERPVRHQLHRRLGREGPGAPLDHREGWGPRCRAGRRGGGYV